MENFLFLIGVNRITYKKEMKNVRTNVKNGLIFLGEVGTDTAAIRIGDIEVNKNKDFIFNTKRDGYYPILGETDENGIVQRLIIDMNPHEVNLLGLFSSEKIIEIPEEDIVWTKNE
jgi:hypothetical protein